MHMHGLWDSRVVKVSVGHLYVGYAMAKKAGFLLSLAVLFTACSVPPPPDADEALALALPGTTEVPDQFGTGGELTGALPANWIETFQDPQLITIVDEALANNLNLQAAASQVEAAGGFVTQVGAQMKPVVSAAGEGAEVATGSGARDTTTDLGIGISWEIDIWGKLRAQTAASEAQFQAITADYEFARLSLKGQVAKTWFTAVEMHLQLLYADEVVAIYEKSLEIVQAKQEFGDVGMKDVYLARADLASAQERRRQVDSAHQTSVRALEVLLGRYPANELAIADEFVAVPPPIPAGMPSELLDRRPDLIASQQRVAAAFNTTFAAKQARLPSLSLTGSAGQTNSQLTDLLGTDTFFNVGANFLAPIYSGGALQAEVDISTAEQEGALAQYGQTALIAFSEVENSLADEGLLSEREELLDAVLEDNGRALEIAELEYDAGQIELLSLLQMRARVINAQVASISIRNNRLAERVNLHLALGGDFVEPTEPETAEADPSI